MEYLGDYTVERNRMLRVAGFNPDKLTGDQKDVILEPEEAPENYACDGEITADEAMSYWRQRLKESGLNRLGVLKAVKYHFGND